MFEVKEESGCMMEQRGKARNLILGLIQQKKILTNIVWKFTQKFHEIYSLLRSPFQIEVLPGITPEFIESGSGTPKICLKWC